MTEKTDTEKEKDKLLNELKSVEMILKFAVIFIVFAILAGIAKIL